MLGQWFQSWRRCLVAVVIEGQTLQQLLCLARVGFKFNTIGCISKHSVKNSELGCIIGSRSQSTALAKLVHARELSIEPIQPNLGPSARKVVAMDAASYTSILVDEDTRARLALYKTDVLHEP